ncbi:MAG TPA: hypothetical protein PK283_08305 [Thiotrichales bacterium]|nr:hypothetical protein [Thiotrichales bacterium]HQR95295.1 hypothetical protein [Thiotrichales bacterium]
MNRYKTTDINDFYESVVLDKQPNISDTRFVINPNMGSTGGNSHVGRCPSLHAVRE